MGRQNRNHIRHDDGKLLSRNGTHAMFRNYQVVFLSDATGTFDYPDVGQGALSAADVHRATLTILAFSRADVMTVDEFKTRVVGANVAAASKAA